jgi:hypothetical protein
LDGGPEAPPAAAPEPGPSASASDDLDLDLAFDPRKPAARRRPQGGGGGPSGPADPAGGPDAAEPAWEEVERAGGFGPRPAGVASYPAYAWRVLRRRKALAAELQALREQATRARKARVEAFAAWGRTWGRAFREDREMADPVAAAVGAHRAHEGFLEASRAEIERLRGADAALARELAAAAAEREKASERLAAAERAWAERGNDVRRARARIGRSDIEMRNWARALTGSPAPGSAQETRRLELEAERTAALAATESAESAERAARREVDAIRSKRDAADAAIEARRAAAATDPARVRFETERARLRDALDAALCELTVEALDRDRIPEGAVDDVPRLRALDAADGAAARALRLHEAAAASIDRRAVALGAGIPAAVLLLLLILWIALR